MEMFVVLIKEEVFQACGQKISHLYQNFMVISLKRKTALLISDQIVNINVKTK